MSVIGYIAVCDYCSTGFVIKDMASLNIAKAMMDAIEEKIVANSDHVCECAKPIIPTFEEIEKEIEESEKHLPQVVAAPAKVDSNPLEQVAHPEEPEEKPVQKTLDASSLESEPETPAAENSSTPETEEDVVKARVQSKGKTELIDVLGTKISYAIVCEDIVVRYYSNYTYATIEKIQDLAKLENGELKKEMIDYLGGMYAKPTKISALRQFVGCVRDGIVKLSLVEEKPESKVSKPVPKKMAPTMSRDQLLRMGLL